jgi:hypothetical protein
MQLVLVLYRSRAEYFIVVEKFDDDAELGVAADYGCFPHVDSFGGANT